MSTEHLVRLFEHNLWANRLVLEACSGLSAEQLATSVDGTYGALGPTLAHLTAAEAGYVWRFDQAEDRFSWDEGDPVPTVEEMARVLEQTGTRCIELAGTVPADQQISYSNGEETRRWPAWVILGQVIDHGREHRSHAATILTQLGIEPPSVDMWDYGISIGVGPD